LRCVLAALVLALRSLTLLLVPLAPWLTGALCLIACGELHPFGRLRVKNLAATRQRLFERTSCPGTQRGGCRPNLAAV
jgi:hypothetical protein